MTLFFVIKFSTLIFSIIKNMVLELVKLHIMIFLKVHVFSFAYLFLIEGYFFRKYLMFSRPNSLEYSIKILFDSPRKCDKFSCMVVPIRKSNWYLIDTIGFSLGSKTWRHFFKWQSNSTRSLTYFPCPFFFTYFLSPIQTNMSY